MLCTQFNFVLLEVAVLASARQRFPRYTSCGAMLFRLQDTTQGLLPWRGVRHSQSYNHIAVLVLTKPLLLHDYEHTCMCATHAHT